MLYNNEDESLCILFTNWCNFLFQFYVQSKFILHKTLSYLELMIIDELEKEGPSSNKLVTAIQYQKAKK